MPRTHTPYVEMLLGLMSWKADPKQGGPRLLAAAEAYLADLPADEEARKVQRYTEQLAHAGLRCAAATPGQIDAAREAIEEIAALAKDEQERLSKARAQRPPDLWERRADLIG